MIRTLVLFGHCNEVEPGDNEGTFSVSWSDAVNFQDVASFLIQGEFENAVIIPVNATAGTSESASVHITIERARVNFKGFVARFWLRDKPYSESTHDGEVVPLDFDWVAYIPCASFLTG
ncbi:MAG: hypothetical protein ABIV13_00460 [Fimbriimonadales bacterium]